MPTRMDDAFWAGMKGDYWDGVDQDAVTAELDRARTAEARLLKAYEAKDRKIAALVDALRSARAYAPFLQQETTSIGQKVAAALALADAQEDA